MTATFRPGLEHLRVPLDSVRPHPDNPRNGDTEAIVASIRANGVYRPIVVQASTRFILAGNHTYAALAELGSPDVAAVVIECSDDEARRIMLADNRTADLGRYDDALLADLLQQITDAEGTLDGTGYADTDLADLLASLRAPDLDDLADEHGEPTEEDTYVRVTLRLPEDVAALWRVAGTATGQRDDLARDCALVRAAYTAVTGDQP